MKNNRNSEIREMVERNVKLYRGLRRSDLVMQFRQFMVAKKIKNIDLAERIGVSEANVSRWLKGNQNLSLDTIYLLADALQESVVVRVGEDLPVSQCDLNSAVEMEGQWSKCEETYASNVYGLEQYREALRYGAETARYARPKSQLIGEANECVDDCTEAAA